MIFVQNQCHGGSKESSWPEFFRNAIYFVIAFKIIELWATQK